MSVTDMTWLLKPAVIAITLAVGAPWATAGEVREDQRAPSAALGGEIAYTIYLPDGYSEPDCPIASLGDHPAT